MNKKSLAIKTLVVASVFGFVGIVVGHHLAISHYFDPEISEQKAELEKYLPEVQKDLEILRERPAFAQVEFTKNAEPYIRPHISWEGERVELSKSKDSELVRKIFSDHQDWAVKPEYTEALKKDKRIMQVNTKWMDKLLEYSHFDFSSHPKVQKELAEVKESNGIKRISIMSRLSLPHFGEFQNWARVYLIQKIRSGEPIEGFKIFRKMAELSNSTQTLVGAMIGARMLQEERKWLNGLRKVDWDTVPEDSIQAHKALNWAWLGIHRHAAMHREIPSGLERFATYEYGVCPAVYEYGAGLELYSDLMNGSFPFEYDLKDEIAKSREIRKLFSETCNLGSMDAFWGPTKAEAYSWFGKRHNGFFGLVFRMDGPIANFNWGKLPYLRSFMGMFLVHLTSNDYFKQYERRGLASK